MMLILYRRALPVDPAHIPTMYNYGSLCKLHVYVCLCECVCIYSVYYICTHMYIICETMVCACVSYMCVHV